MVYYVPDRTGRFRKRPFWKEEELDRECETLITAFLRRRHNKVEYPVQTDDLTVMIEEEVESLDPYADLSKHGPDVEGVTIFTPGRKPRVEIASFLSEDERRENRLRTTLTHEYGHVHFHGPLFAEHQDQMDLFASASVEPDVVRCKRDTMIEAPQVDWMEWQAGYVCGALLMPLSAVRRTLGAIHERLGSSEPVCADSLAGEDMIQAVVRGFQVSSHAARVRLQRLGYLGTPSGSQSLFTTV